MALHLDDLATRLIVIPDYPQLRMAAPNFRQLAEIEERMGGLGEAKPEEMDAAVLWFVGEFVRDAGGDRLEGLDAEGAAKRLPFDLVVRCMRVIQPEGDDGPSRSGAPAS